MESCCLAKFFIAVLILFLSLGGFPATASLSGVSSCKSEGRPGKLGENCRARKSSVENTVIWFQSLRGKQPSSPPAPRHATTRSYFRNVPPPPPKPQSGSHVQMSATPPLPVPPPPSRR